MKPAAIIASAVISALALSQGVLSHPGHDITEEVLERRSYLGSVRRSSLGHCAESLRARGVEDRNVRRRAATVEKARFKRSLKKRDNLDDVLDTDHNKTDLGYNENISAGTLFSSNNSCLLTPEVTQGPYYVGGEYVRENIIEKQEGVNIILDYQVVDVDTCEPVQDVYVEIWHCNATGVYSGVVASGNGDSDDSSNIDKTFLRGIQQTDSDGAAQFESIFPGHYTGRATHIHVLVHANATLYKNSTLGNDVYASHVGQAFFDQDLIAEVDKSSPYSDNSQSLTSNDEDSILAEEADTDGVDPLMEYTLLGDSVSDGLFAWLSFGINTTASDSVSPAAFLYESGGVENENSSMGGGPGGGGPGGSGGGDGPPGSRGGDAASSTVGSDATSTSTDDGAAAASSSSTNAAADSNRDLSYGLLMLGQLFALCVAVGAGAAMLRGF